MKAELYEEYFTLSQSDLKLKMVKELGDFGYKNVLSEDGFVFAQGTHPVLLVAHMDTVHRQLPKDILYSKDGTKVLSLQGIGGDDRCGIIIIRELIKNIKCSVLFTEDEEIGGIGAEKFIKSGIVPENISYIVEFDRANGNDFVFYKDCNLDFSDMIASYGFIESNGSFSDISVLAPHFKLEAVNISSGYHSPHTNGEWVDFSEVEDILTRSYKMILENTEKFEYVEDKPKPLYNYYTNSYWKQYYDNWDSEEEYSYYYGYGVKDYKPKSELVEVETDYVPFNELQDTYTRVYTDKDKEKEYYSQPAKTVTNKKYKLLVKGKEKKFRKVYITPKNEVFWNKDCTHKVCSGWLYDKIYGYAVSYDSIALDI